MQVSQWHREVSSPDMQARCQSQKAAGGLLARGNDIVSSSKLPSMDFC